MGSIDNIRNECPFSWFIWNRSECETNKSCQSRSGFRTTCLFCTPIHSPLTQIIKHSFFILTMLQRPFPKFLREKLYIPITRSNSHLACHVNKCACDLTNRRTTSELRSFISDSKMYAWFNEGNIIPL